MNFRPKPTAHRTMGRATGICMLLVALLGCADRGDRIAGTSNEEGPPVRPLRGRDFKRVERALSSTNIEVQLDALEELATRAAGKERTSDMIISAYNSNSNRISIEVARFNSISNLSLVEAARFRYNAIAAIGMVGSPRGIHFLIERVKERTNDWFLADSAVEALRKVGPKAAPAEPVLLGILEDFVRDTNSIPSSLLETAVWTVATLELRSARALRAVERVLETPGLRNSTRDLCISFFRDAGTPEPVLRVIPALLTILGNSTNSGGKVSSVHTIEALANDMPDAMKAQCAAALSSLLEEDAPPYPGPVYYWGSVMTALARLGTNATQAVPRLREIERSSTNKVLRAMAGQAANEITRSAR